MNIEERTARFYDCLEKLKKQGARSLNDVGGCQYRGDGGNKCAVGMYIPDEIYSEEMENHGVKTVLYTYPEVWEALKVENEEDIQLYSVLQNIHDTGCFLGNFEDLNYYRRSLALRGVILDKGDYNG